MSNEHTTSPIARRASRLWFALLKLGFHLLYNELAWTYDAVSWLVSRGQWRAWQMAALPYLQGQTVLELAHGPGHMLLALASAGFRTTGLDLSPWMGRQARRKVKSSGAPITLVRGQAQTLPFAAHAFDSVLSTFPTEFLVEPAAIGAIHRVLRPGGRLVVVPQARLVGQGTLTRLIEWLFAITGQRPQALANEGEQYWQVVGDRFLAAGFVLKVEIHRNETSEVTVVIAQKPSPGSGRSASPDVSSGEGSQPTAG